MPKLKSTLFCPKPPSHPKYWLRSFSSPCQILSEVSIFDIRYRRQDGGSPYRRVATCCDRIGGRSKLRPSLGGGREADGPRIFVPPLPIEKRCKNGSRPLGRNHRFHWGIRLLMVGPRGFEPLTFCTPSKRATRLRYGPKTASSISQSSDEVKWGSRSFVLGQRSLSPENRGRACGKPCKHGLLLEYGSRSGVLKKVHFCLSPLPRAPPDRAVECGKPLAKEGRRGGKGRVSEKVAAQHPRCANQLNVLHLQLSAYVYAL